MARGDHIQVQRGLYTHHGIDVGHGRVAHYSGLANGLRGGPVEVVTMEEFARGGTLRLVPHRRRLPPDEIVDRALGRVGEDAYHVLINNCEHFAHWAATGEKRSPQVRRAVGAAALLTMAAAGLGIRKLGNRGVTA